MSDETAPDRPPSMMIDIVYHDGRTDRAMYSPDEAARLLNDFLSFVNDGYPQQGTYHLFDLDWVSLIGLDVDFTTVARVSTK